MAPQTPHSVISRTTFATAPEDITAAFMSPINSGSDSDSDAEIDAATPMPLTEENLRRTVSQTTSVPAEEDEDEEEFHTEASEVDEDEEDEDGVQATGPPLLPDELLNGLPSGVASAKKPRKAVQPQRTGRYDESNKLAMKYRKKHLLRKLKRRAKYLEVLANEAKATGVLEAGRAAQKKRGINAVRGGAGAVKSGRVEKSGRAKLLESRKVHMLARERSKR